MSSKLTCLVTGTTRGIGRGLVEAYLSIPGTTVIATVRDPHHSTIEILHGIAKEAGSSLIVVQMDAGSSKSIVDAFKNITESHGIQSLDVVIANAGVGGMIDSLTETPVSLIQNYIDVNAYGPLELFKSALPLLRKSAQPKFCTISSLAGSVNAMNTMFPTAPYGASKALVNYFIRWLAHENEDVITWTMHPGLVATDMGNSAVQDLIQAGVDANAFTPISVEDSVKGIAKVISGASKEKTSGRFLGHDGVELPW
ncbi:hypothetical protein EDB81DRAFT_932604 [Dactylonectria macrodidyma]|uniref:NAD(P)-binding protein n=1 Tax=Dactylonectria macrodidyma TaxID=307937 RepID=A0A9P9EXW5_9HYPO|nr:hypothetical protein EDB81DRAFT_932604 [Dactylonectria macrodidyma]